MQNLKKTVDSSNINFLLGAGVSAPFLAILGNIEKDLTDAEKIVDKGTKEAKILELKKTYFTESMFPNLQILKEEDDSVGNTVLVNYRNFYKTLNSLMFKRANSILTKQVNVFTTNIDVFSEKALESTGVEFNDGFHGRFNPKYDLGNFKKSYFKKSLHYENTSEIPVFNILKLHGSLSWKEKDGSILFDKELGLVNECNDNAASDVEFLESYSKLRVVNPTKKKFEDTVLGEQYYDLLRLYSNELEKESSVLFVIGFSFADEHIRDMTIRAANSNPTLKVYIFSYSPEIEPSFQDLISSFYAFQVADLAALQAEVEKRFSDFAESSADIEIAWFSDLITGIVTTAGASLEEVLVRIKNELDYIFIYKNMTAVKNNNIKVIYPVDINSKRCDLASITKVFSGISVSDAYKHSDDGEVIEEVIQE